MRFIGNLHEREKERTATRTTRGRCASKVPQTECRGGPKGASSEFALASPLRDGNHRCGGTTMNNRRRREFLKIISAGAIGAAQAEAQPARPRIKIGQIGVAHGHAAKIATYRQSADYEVVGIVEPDAALRTRAQAQEPFRGLTWLTQEQLLNVPGLQAVLIETRVSELLPTAGACIAAGKHVHIDKPAGASLPQLRRLLTAAARQRLLVQLGYMYRYNPGFTLMLEFLRRGWLGEIFEVHGVMSKVVAEDERRRLAEFRGGMMFELGCHLIDLIVAALAKPAEVAPFALHSSPLQDALMDNTLAVLTYPRTIATVRTTALELDGFERRHLVFCGAEGTFHIQPLDNPSARVTLSRVRGEHVVGYQDIRLPRYTRYVADAADMARIIRGDKASDFSPEHDLAVQETVLKASRMPIT
jgi:predicted dehydrogenase